MSTTSKKLVSIALTASTALWSLGVASLPLANAQSASSIQSQIAALLAQINQLQSQLGTSGSTTGSTSASMTFTRDLTVGSRGADVTSLQNFLAGKGYLSVSATGYFGSMTKAALAKFQAANGITPAAGYFGPKTRAFVNSMSVGTGTTGTTGTGTTGTGTTGTGTTGTTAPATGLMIGTASDAPTAGSLISGSARNPVAGVNFTAGNSGAVTISEVKFHKTGVVSDSSISGAYLTQNGKVIAQYNSINSGVIDFSGLNISVPAGQTLDLQLAIDIATGLSAGNTVSFMVSPTDVTAWDVNNTAVTPTGSAVNGNIFTVTNVSNPSLASMTVASSSIGTQVTAGTQGNLVGAWNITVSNSKIYLKSINFRVIGSANKGDLRNVVLKVNGTQVGATLATVAQDGTAYFNALANPATLNTGSNNVQIFADVMGSPSYNFQFEILNSYDIYATDSQYNVPISGASNIGTQVSIQNGQITLTQDSNTPTGNVAKGQSQVTLAKFDFYAAGEAVKVKWLSVQLALTGGNSGIDSDFKNLSLTDDAGGQLGSTINTLSTSATCTDNAFSSATSSYTNCFGSSASPINYIIPANTTRVLSLKADIQSTADFTSVVGKILANSSNLQGLTSGSTNSTGAASGAARSLASSSLTVGQNNSLGSQAVSKGVSNQKIGSYALTASSAEGVSVSTVSIQAFSSDFQNLKVMVGGAQFGTTQSTVSSGTIYTFSGTPFNVPVGTTVNVDVYADVLSSASTNATPYATTLTGCSATGLTSFASISCTSQTGQSLTLAGQSSITVTADSSQAPVGQIVMGTTGNPLATFRFTETSNVENVKITSLNVLNNVASTTTVKPGFNNLQLWNGSTLVGTAGVASTTTAGPGYIYTFNFGTPLVVPQANSISLVLKGDAASYASSGATDNATSTFSIATTTDGTNNTTALAVVALGNTSNASTSVTLSSAQGNQQTLRRSKLTFAATPLGAATGRGKISSDQLATLSFTANSAGSIVVNTVTITFSGTAPSSTTFLDGVSLRDENNNVLGTGNTTSTACSGGTTTCTKTFSLGASTNGQVVSAGQTRNWTLVVDSTKTQAVTSTNNVNLVATVNAIGDISYTDALDSSAISNLNMPSSVLTPINLNSVVYAQGT